MGVAMYGTLVAPNYAGIESARLTAGQNHANAVEKLADSILDDFLTTDDPKSVADRVGDVYELLAELITIYRTNCKVPDGDAINGELELLFREYLRPEAVAIAEKALEGF